MDTSSIRQRRGLPRHGTDHTHADHHRTHEPSMDGHISCFSWMLLVAVFYFSIVSLNILLNNHLPVPKTIAASKPTEFTEERARQHLQNFVKVGSRPSGSYENDVYSVRYILQTIAEIQASSKSNKRIEVDLQRPTGSFFLPHLDDFITYYSNVSNTVVRITSPESDDNALLLNCHTDSVANAPGASDDAVACSILLEIFRTIMADDTPLLHPLIFLFNGAEENILQASHGFITQHKWVKQIKAFINLEAGGAGFKEFLFQTGPENPWLVWAWAKHAPHPHGTSVGQDLFQSGIIPSDTDFRIFRDHGHIPGMDLAYIRNGYVYHTLHDTAEMIQPGCVQRAGENIYSVVRHLVLSPDSLLPDPSDYRHGAVAYFDVLGLTMVVVPLRLIAVLNYFTILAVLAYIGKRMIDIRTTGYTTFQYSRMVIKAVAVNILGYAACFLSLALLGAFLTKYNRSLSWYSQPPLAFGLYVPAGLLGLITVHCIAKMTVFKDEDSRKLEGLFFDAALIMWSSLIFQTRNVGSSYMFMVMTIFPVIGRGFFGHEAFSNRSSAPGINRVVMYLGVTILPLMLVVDKLLLVGSVFMALAGRSGSELPPEVFVFIIIGIAILACFSFQVCTVYLVNSLKWFYVIMLACLACSITVTFTRYGFPFDSDPLSPANKRFYMQHTQREFYKFDGSLERQDSGMFVCHLDYIGLTYDIGAKDVMKAPVKKCEGVYCDLPFTMPVGKLVRKYQYFPTAPPSAFVNDEKHPFSVISKRTVSKTSNGLEVKLDISIRGPPFMNLHITPIKPGSLVEWSFDSDIKGTDSKATENETYFVMYGGGMEHPPWEFWLKFSVPSTAGNDPVLVLAASAHYKTSGPVSRVNKQTPELEKMTLQLHDWVAPITWVSLYKKYKL